MKTTVSYRDAAIVLWGEAGAYAHDAYTRLRLVHFPHLPEQLPIVIGLAAYGHCLGLTAGHWEHGPRISLASEVFTGSRERFNPDTGRMGPGRIRGGTGWVDDTLIHEMLHADLNLTGLNPKHDSTDWYDALRRLSRAVLGQDLDIRRGADRKSVRVPNPDYQLGNGKPKTLVRKVAAGDLGWNHDMVSRWPYSFRPEGYDWGERILCPSY